MLKRIIVLPLPSSGVYKRFLRTPLSGTHAPTEGLFVHSWLVLFVDGFIILGDIAYLSRQYGAGELERLCHNICVIQGGEKFKEAFNG
jgi:hypothetical protein